MTSSIKGMGSCAIPGENGWPCGRQIAQGESIGTVIINKQPSVGHKRCADAYTFREMQGTNVVKRADQQADGSVGPERDALGEGSFPLTGASKPEPAPPPNARAQYSQLPAGVVPLAELPFDDEAPSQKKALHVPLTQREPQAQLDYLDNAMAGLSDAERKVLEEYRKSIKPEPHVIELDLSKLPANADLHIHIKR